MSQRGAQSHLVGYEAGQVSAAGATDWDLSTPNARGLLSLRRTYAMEPQYVSSPVGKEQFEEKGAQDDVGIEYRSTGQVRYRSSYRSRSLRL